MYVYVCVCVHACTWAQGMHMPWQVWEGQGLVLSFFPEGPQGSDSGYQTWRQGPLPAVPSCRPSVFFYVHWDRAFMGNRIVYVTYLTLDWFLVQNSDSIRISDCGVCMCSDACVCIPACMHVCVLCVCEHVCSDNNHSCHSQQYYPLPLRQDSHGPGAYQLGMNSPVLASSELGLQVGTTTSAMFDFWGIWIQVLRLARQVLYQLSLNFLFCTMEKIQGFCGV